MSNQCSPHSALCARVCHSVALRSVALSHCSPCCFCPSPSHPLFQFVPFILQIRFQFLRLVQQLLLVLVGGDENFVQLLILKLVKLHLSRTQLAGAQKTVEECVGRTVTDVLDTRVKRSAWRGGRESRATATEASVSGLLRVFSHAGRFVWYALVPLMLATASAAQSKRNSASERASEQATRSGVAARKQWGCRHAHTGKGASECEQTHHGHRTRGAAHTDTASKRAS